MKKATFERLSEESLIVIDCKLNKHKVLLAIREVEIETASGVIKGYVFVLKTFSAIDTILTNIEVCAYDFFANHLLTDFDGVLGLDFFKNVKFCIDMKNSEITIQ